MCLLVLKNHSAELLILSSLKPPYWTPAFLSLGGMGHLSQNVVTAAAGEELEKSGGSA